MRLPNEVKDVICTYGITYKKINYGSRDSRLHFYKYSVIRIIPYISMANNILFKKYYFIYCFFSHMHGLNIVIRNINIPIIKKFTIKNYKFTCTVMDRAAKNDLNVVKWLHTHRAEGCTDAACDNAAEYGRLDIVTWLYENRKEGCSDWALYIASTRGHIDIINYLYAKNIKKDFVLYNAATNGHFHIVKWLFENVKDVYYDHGTICTARDNNHTEIVKYIESKMSASRRKYVIYASLITCAIIACVYIIKK